MILFKLDRCNVFEQPHWMVFDLIRRPFLFCIPLTSASNFRADHIYLFKIKFTENNIFHFCGPWRRSSMDLFFYSPSRLYLWLHWLESTKNHMEKWGIIFEMMSSMTIPSARFPFLFRWIENWAKQLVKEWNCAGTYFMS
jgi:hypothetical protein